MKDGLVALIRDRRSARVYTQESMTLEQLSFLLWATQGVKGLAGEVLCHARTVPCGGARHEFETYLLLRQVDGLRPGAYHYLPMEHALEYLHPEEHLEQVISDSLDGQSWAAKANVVFYWGLRCHTEPNGDTAFTPIVISWWMWGMWGRTCIWRAPVWVSALVESGRFPMHALQSSLWFGRRRGICCVCGPVGTVRAADQAQEQAFYQFVEDEGL